MIKVDYPAAHSMDTDWFAIDDAGEVAFMKSGEDGPVPQDTLSQSSVYDLLDYLDKDEHGTPLLPSIRDPFPQGPSTEELERIFVNLPELQRTAIKQLASQSDLSEAEKLKLKESVDRLYVSAVVWLTDPSDLKEFEDPYPVIRLDPARAIYFISGSHRDALRLLAKQRLLAWRKIDSSYYDRLDLSDLHGIYIFESNYCRDDTEEYLNDGVCPPTRSPALYEKIKVPERPRIGLPPKVMFARFPDNGHAYPLIHALPGVRFSDMAFLQLADLVPCFDWGTGPHRPDSGNSIIRKNMQVVHQVPSAGRAAYITKWRLAAEQGDMVAQYSLAYAYTQEQPADYSQAFYWYHKAAQQADAAPCASSDMYENGSAAQCCLADLYERGLGVPQDYAQALHWFAKSAAQKNRFAQRSLGLMYQRGLGVPQDKEQARAWFTKASAWDMLRELDKA